MVGVEGLEPSKSKTAVLQTAAIAAMRYSQNKTLMFEVGGTPSPLIRTSMPSLSLRVRVFVVRMGFEPMIFRVTGGHPLQTGPTDEICRGPDGDRTHDHLINSQELYR